MDSGKINLKRVIRALEKKEIKDFDVKFEAAKNKYSSFLSLEQQKAFYALEGQYLVIAGAGSGKTRTIVYRSAFLLEKGIEPESILMITFTRKACYEMKERLEKIVGKKNIGIKIMTFHSFCAHLLYKYKSVFKIADLKIIADSQKENIIKKILELEEITKFKIEKRPSLDKVVKCISKLNILKKTENSRDDKKTLQYIKLINARFNEYKKENDFFEFDDIIEKVVKKLQENKRFLNYLRNKIKYLVVDEYQDSNFLQRSLLKLLVGNTGNLMVVGDDYQSIYGFRGADFTNILKFGVDFPDAKLIKMKTNYRSADQIIKFTNKIAEKFRLKYEKTACGTDKKNGKIYRNQFKNEDKQWEYICKKIEKLYESGVGYNEIGILFRNRYVTKKLESYLKRFEIPFHKKEEDKQDGVALLSIHSAKGLEWEAVFVPTLLEGVFPSYETLEELEEEKRLFYVACSRAKRFLFLLYPQFFYEKTGYFDKKSQFLLY